MADCRKCGIFQKSCKKSYHEAAISGGRCVDFTPMEKTCKDCEHYEPYDGPEEPCESDETKAVMKCTSLERRKKLTEDGYKYYGIYAKTTSQRTCTDCDYFTPKKPKEEKVENCNNCKDKELDALQEPCRSCRDYAHWRPIEPKAVSPEEKKRCENCGYQTITIANHPCIVCRPEQNAPSDHRYWKPKPVAPEEKKEKTGWHDISNPKTLIGVDIGIKGGDKTFAALIDSNGYVRDYKELTPNPKQKEKTMWNKIRYYYRRYGTACELVVTFWLCKLVHPLVLKFWWSIGTYESCNETGKCAHYYMVPWICTVVSIASILGFLYGFHRFTAWKYGEDK